MMTFGLLSSVFDYLTFGVLLLLCTRRPIEFRTGWFVESVVSASLIVLVIRTRQPFFKSRPGRHLLAATVLVVAATLALPYTPIAPVLGLTPLPAWYPAVLGAIVALYIGAAELTKRVFYRRAGAARSNPPT